MPEGWGWGRLGQLVYNHGQRRPSTDFSYIDISSIDNQHQRLSCEENILSSEKAPSRARKIIAYGDILYSTVRPYLHNMCIIDRIFSKQPIASTGFAVLTCHNDFFNEFLFYYMMSPDFDTYVNHTDNAKGVAYPSISDTRLYQALIPIPPAREQRDIVSAVKRLIPYINKYNIAREQLNRLMSNFPNAMKHSILQWAVQGKLVQQDENDEPASVLLERIRAEKEELIKQGKIKRDKRESVIYRGADNSYYERFADGSEKCIDEEIPFEIPKGWAWGRIFSITTDLSYGTAKKSLTKGKIAVIRMGNIQAGEINYDDLMYSSDEADILRYCLEKNDLLFNRTNSPDLVGKTAIYRGDMPAIYAGYLIRIHTFIDSEYLNIVMNSNYARRYYNLVKTDGVNQSNINAKNLAVFIIPIPPFEEQRRIAKQEKTIRSILFECMR